MSVNLFPFHYEGSTIGPVARALSIKQTNLINNLEVTEVIKQNIETAITNLQSKSLENRFIYKIQLTEDGPILGHLMGTFHYVTKQVAHDPVFARIVEKSNKLYLETLPAQELTKDFIKREEVTKEAGFDYIFDRELYLKACHSNIPVYALDTHEELNELHNRSKDAIKEGVRVTRNIFSWLTSRNQKEQTAEQFENYVMGDSNIVHSHKQTYDPKCREILLFERNRKWVGPLVQQLKDHDPSQGFLNVATGVQHLLGNKEEDCLIQLLRRNNFVVTRLTQEEQNSYIS